MIIQSGNDCQIRAPFVVVAKKSAVVLVLGILPIARQGKDNGMASLVSSKNQDSSSGIEVKFDQRKRNLVRVSGEYQIYEFELSKKKNVTEKEGLIQGKWGLVGWLAGSSRYPSSSYPSLTVFTND